MAITATDNKELATELWGDEKYWDEDRKQFLPKKKEGEDVSVGSNSKTSSSETEKSEESSKQSHPENVRTTEPRSTSEKVGTTAPSTGGSGKAKK